MPSGVPAQVTSPGSRDEAREGRLADLARPGDEDHLPGQVLAHLGFEVTPDVPFPGHVPAYRDF
jgi:hypothetical protein